MLHFEGDRDFPLPLAHLFALLGDAGFLVRCLPDVESVAQSDADRAIFVIRPGFSFVRGTLNVNLEITERVEGKSIRMQVASKAIGSTSRLETGLAFAAQDGGTRVHWTADITELGGLLKAVPQGLIKAAAQKVIGDVWAALETKLAGG